MDGGPNGVWFRTKYPDVQKLKIYSGNPTKNHWIKGKSQQEVQWYLDENRYIMVTRVSLYLIGDINRVSVSGDFLLRP